MMQRLDHASYLGLSRFGSLDGLRALSIIAVVWHHTKLKDVKGLLDDFGNYGVSLFFAISGFLITSLLLRERLRSGRIDLRGFYVRRTLRIFPLYFGTLALYAVLVLVLERNTVAGRAFWSNLPYFLTYTSNLFVELEDRTIFYFAWSLATEEQFYLIWPALVIALAAAGRAAWALLAALVAVAVGHWMQSRFMYGVPVAMLGGALWACLLHTPTGYARLVPWMGAWIMPWFVAVAVAVSMTYPSIVPPYVTHFLLSVLVASCAMQRRHGLSFLLDWKPMAYIGTISYGVYMLHMLCKNAAQIVLGKLGLPTMGLLLAVVTMALTVAVATVSFRTFEAYFMRQKKPLEAWLDKVLGPRKVALS
jgi:peptidoglycan/LPS O-acetylase OafA/YrhL